MKRRVTIRDVARVAGVSTATVSRALDGSGRVAELARERVARAVSETGYRANPSARDLRRGRSASVLLLVPNLANPFFSEIIEAVGAECAAAGLSVQIADTRHGALASPERIVALGTDGRSDGVICLDGGLSAEVVAGIRVPFVMACEWHDGVDLQGVRVDNAAGARLAVDHLRSLGHERLLHVEGPEGNVLSRARRDGFEQACAEDGLDFAVLAGDFSLKSGGIAADIWSATDRKARATGIFCASDECALGFVSRAIALGHRVPEDVSVCGFDDIAIAPYFVPALTTIHQPRSDLGRQAAGLLLDLLAGGGPVPVRTLPVSLIARSSTGSVGPGVIRSGVEG